MLLFRIGDFYECFGEDAVELSSLLNLQLTSRTSGHAMAGVPQHAVWTYVAKLKALGRSVALADQMESPEEAKSAGRRLVKREITRVVTPGTAVDDELLDDDRSAYLAAVAPTDKPGQCEIMWSDVAAGNGGRLVCTTEEAVAQLRSLSVQELLLCGGISSFPQIDAAVRTVAMPEHGSCEDAIRSYLKVSLSSGSNSNVSLSSQPSFARLRFDVVTRQALDLQQSCVRIFTSSGHRYQPASLRLLRERISSPLSGSEVTEITSRLSAVQLLLNDSNTMRHVQNVLTRSEMYGDAERALQRIALGGVHRSALHLARDIKAVCLAMQMARQFKLPPSASQRWSALDEMQNKFSWVEEVLAKIDSDDALGIAKGADRLLDQLRDPGAARDELAQLEQEIAAEFNVPTVKISRGRAPEDLHFSVQEKFAEIISVAARDNFKLRYVGQRAHSTRWTTDVLEKVGKRHAHRERDAERRSATLLAECEALIVQCVAEVKRVLLALFDLDVTCGAALTALSHNLSVPQIKRNNVPMELDLREVFHPGIQLAQGGNVVSNSLHLSAAAERIGVLTGANMSGKSSLIRAVALVSWCTQCGLPSAQMQSSVSLVDCIFVRVGSTDDITHDKSSFMNEMSGVAALLREPTSMLCCLDELGRSTAPEDGAAFCGALIRELASRPNVLSLLSTHFSSLSLMHRQQLLPNTALWNLEVLVRDGEPPVFTHKLRSGQAKHSLAFAVAKLAGVPDRLIVDAELLRHRVMRD